MKRSKQVGFTYEDLVNYMGHIAYMCMHTSILTYTDRAFRSYDKAIRDKVKEEGVSAFKMRDHEVSLLHFKLEK